MHHLPSPIILWDTEYTTWEGAKERDWSGPHEYRELVQIGAVRIDTETFEEINTLLLYVKPVRNPALSQYFIDLTHITQEDVESCGVPFRDAAATFLAWIKDDPCYAYGHDKKVLDLNYELHGIENTFDDSQFHDVRSIFKNAGIDTSKYMSSTIPEAFGIKNPLRGHDALADARSIAQALKLLKEQSL